MTFEEYTQINEFNDDYNPIVAVKLTDAERLINNNLKLTECILNAWRNHNILFVITRNTTVKNVEFAIGIINELELNATPGFIVGRTENNMKNIRSVYKNDVYINNLTVNV